MAATTRIHALKVAVVDGLALRAGLSGVQVASAWLGDDEAGLEAIMLDGPDDLTGDWAMLGKFAREERITLHGVVKVRSRGAGETTIRAARERAAALFAEIEAFIVADPSVGLVVRVTRIRPQGLAETFDSEGRLAILMFQIEAESRLTTS